MQAVWNGKVIAEANKEDLIYIEQNWYFPPSSVKQEYLRKSDTPYTCPWKGECQYFDVGDGDTWSKDSAWSYPDPKSTAIDIVKKDFSGYIAFWRDVQVAEALDYSLAAPRSLDAGAALAQSSSKNTR